MLTSLLLGACVMLGIMLISTGIRYLDMWQRAKQDEEMWRHWNEYQRMLDKERGGR